MTREQENGIGRNPEHPSGVEVKSIAAEYHPTENQDAYFTLPEQKAFGVFDGVGGAAGGKEAAELARKHVLDELPNLAVNATADQAKDFLRTLLTDVSKRLAEGGPARQLQTTGSIALVVQEGRKKKLVVGNVGDSRVYLYHKNKKLEQLTIDDFLRLRSITMPSRKVPDAAIQVRSISDKEARETQRILSNVVDPSTLPPDVMDLFKTRNDPGQRLGDYSGVGPFIRDFKLSKGDKILITSDGVHDNLTDSEMGDVFRNRAYGDLVTENLIQRAKSISTKGVPRSKQDDMTALVVDVDSLFVKGSKPKPREVPSGAVVEQPVQSVTSSQEAQVVLQSEARPEPPANAPVSGLKQRLKDGPRATQILVNEKAREYRDKKRREEEKERQELKRAQKGKDRRKLLKLGVTTVIGTAIGISGGLASWAIADTIKENSALIGTGYGKFYPLYERDLSLEKLPPRLDFFFPQLPMRKEEFEAHPADLLVSSGLKPELLEEFAKNGTYVVFADGPGGVSEILRNRVMGLKMLTVAQFLKSRTKKDAISAYQVDSERTGIETVLRLKVDDAIKTVLNETSREVLVQAIERSGGMESGGIENFSRIRIIELPRNFKASDLTDASRRNLVIEWMEEGSNFGNAELYKKLRQKLVPIGS